MKYYNEKYIFDLNKVKNSWNFGHVKALLSLHSSSIKNSYEKFLSYL